MNKQKLIWIPEGEDVGAIRKRVPPIPYGGDIPKYLWSLYLHTDKDNPPALPYLPVHFENAFLESIMHDYDIKDKLLHYYGCAEEGGYWVLLEFETNP